MPEAISRRAPLSEAAAASTGRRVLVVDDHPDVRAMFSLALEQAGMRVLTAGDGQEALELIERDLEQAKEAGRLMVDLIVLDIMMPGLSGFDVLRTLRARFSELPPVLIISALDSQAHVQEAIALGAEIEKTILEGAGAAGLAALLEYPASFRGQNVGVVLSGGNIDGRVLASVLLRALARSGRLVRLRIEVPDRPGVLASVAQIVGGLRANIVDVEHRRDLPGVALKSARLDLSVETRDRAHADEIVKTLEANGFRVEVA